MAVMSRQAREILQSSRTERLSDAARQLLEASLLQNVEHGQGPLAQNDVDPNRLPSISWWTKPVVMSSWLTLVGLGALALGAIVSGTRLHAPDAVETPPLQASGAATPQASAVDSKQPPPSAADMHSVPPADRADGQALAADSQDRRANQRPQRSARRARAASREQAIATARDARASTTPAPEPPAVPSAVANPASPARPSFAINTLDVELGLLRRAHSELNARRFDQALALLGEHERRFPAGQLTQMREVAFVLALCGLGREAGARTRAQHFLIDYPASPFIGQVRGVCSASTRKAPP